MAQAFDKNNNPLDEMKLVSEEPGALDKMFDEMKEKHGDKMDHMRVRELDAVATRRTAIINVLARHTGSFLGPDRVEMIATEIEQEINDSPCSRLFGLDRLAADDGNG